MSQAGFWEDNSPRTLEEFMSDSDTGSLLDHFWSKWANAMEAEGNSTCGVSFSMKPGKDKKPTYEPTAMVHQVSAYRTKQYPNGVQRGPRDPALNQKIAGRNAFLFCEKVKFRELPQSLPLIWTGNFTTLAHDQYPQVDGTFLLSHDIFLGWFILPELQILNQATEIWHDQPDFYPDKKDGSIRLNNPHNIGRYVNPRDQAQVLSAEKDYAFTPEMDQGDKYRVKSYKWGRQNTTKPLYETETSKYGEKFYCYALMEDTMDTKVTWTPGKPDIYVKGIATLKEKGYWCWDSKAVLKDPSKGRNENNIDWSSATTVLDDVYNVEWNIKITIIKDEDNFDNPEKVQGTLSAIVDAGPNMDGTPTCTLNPSIHTNIIMNGHDDFVKKNVSDRLKKQIPIMIANIKAKLEGAGKFIFPGNGTLVFEKPMFGNWGDLLAQVKYRPVEEGTMRLVPGEPDLQKNPPVETAKKTPEIKVQKFELEWLITPKAPEKIYGRQTTKMVVRAENKTDRDYYYERLIVQFPSGSRPRDLFAADKFTKDPLPKKAGLLESALASLRDTILGKKEKQKEIDREKAEIQRRIKQIVERRQAAEAARARKAAELKAAQEAARIAEEQKAAEAARIAEEAAKIEKEKGVAPQEEAGKATKEGEEQEEGWSSIEKTEVSEVAPREGEQVLRLQEEVAENADPEGQRDNIAKEETPKETQESGSQKGPWAGAPIPPPEEESESAPKDDKEEQDEKDREQDLLAEEAELADLTQNEADLLKMEKDLENAKLDDIKQFSLATLNKSLNFPECVVSIGPLAGGGATQNLFEARITAKKGMLKVPPGAWVELSLEGYTNAVRTCIVEMAEDRKDSSGKATEIYREPRTIPIVLAPRK
ncbi:hypothetical protein ABW19_dt0206338 [Dactylella cylindrospora]|nr:hypothetical protein ABW19_dt0206338 [Dactylella cylindrospora]